MFIVRGIKYILWICSRWTEKGLRSFVAPVVAKLLLAFLILNNLKLNPGKRGPAHEAVPATGGLPLQSGKRGEDLPFIQRVYR